MYPGKLVSSCLRPQMGQTILRLRRHDQRCSRQWGRTYHLKGRDHSSAIPEHSHTTTVHETNALTLQAVNVQIIAMIMLVMEYL